MILSTPLAVHFSYFGYSVSFETVAATVAERRAEANARVIAAYGCNPALEYVEPNTPFPDYVPQLIWDSETNCWY